MTKILTIILLTILIIQAQSRSYHQIIACIKNKTQLNDLTLDQICKFDMTNKTNPIPQSCANSFHSMELCLILNGCHLEKDDSKTDMSPSCWHCWATLQVDEHMKTFQNKFNSPKICSENIMKFMGIIFIFISTLFII